VTAEARRVLGYGLIAAALGITLLLLLWLATSGAEAGGIILGLLLLFVLAGPLAGAGGYILASGRREQVSEQAYAGKRRILESDRLFRQELSARLRDLGSMPGIPPDEIARLADGLNRTISDESAWYDTVQLDDAQIGLLSQYDDLVWEQVRWLRDHAAESARVQPALQRLRQAIDQRTDLLVRGRQAPAVAPDRFLQTPPPASETGLVAELAPGAAITHDGVDYVVDRIASSFADGETWKLAHLGSSGPAVPDRWLSISPGGLELAWLEPIEPPAAGAKEIRVDSTTLECVASVSGLVRIATTSGSSPGVLVLSWRYRGGDSIGLVEQWPDSRVVAYAGKLLRPSDLEIWPAASKPDEAPR
jgi:uncharacterized protein DUF4178